MVFISICIYIPPKGCCFYVIDVGPVEKKEVSRN